MTPHRPLRRIGIAMLAAMALAGCETAGTGAPGGSKSATAVNAVRATLGACMFPPPPLDQYDIKGIGALLGGAVLKSAIGLGVNALGTALTEAAKADVQHVAAVANVRHGQRIDDGATCLQLVRGDFSTGAPATPAELQPLGLGPDQHRALQDNRLLPAGRPDFVFEATFRPAGDGRTLAVVPSFAAFAEPLRSRLLRPGGERRVALHFAFHAPGKQAEDAANPSAALDLGAMRPGSVTRFATPQPDGGDPPSWLPVPGESQWVSTATLGGVYSITVTQWEVQEESKALGFMAALFNSVAGETKTTLEQILIRTEREKARKAAADADLAEQQLDRDRRNAATTAYATAATARAKCMADGSPETAQQGFNAMRNANHAALVAGIEPPFPAVPDLPFLDPAANRRACTDAIRAPG